MLKRLFHRHGIPDRLSLSSGRSGVEAAASVLGHAAPFSPTRPQFTNRGLIGRERELARIVRAICQEQAHVVLFAERGRGKSSLANCVVEHLRQMDSIVARASCDLRMDFDTLIRNLMRSLPASLAASSPDASSQGCEGLLSRSPLSSRDVAELPGLFGGRHLTLVVEEFDRAADPMLRSLVADASKQLSDRGAPVSFFIVGVADDAGELIGDNPSVHRSVVPVELALLPKPAIRAIVDRGFRMSGMSVQSGAAELIVELAAGTPYIAQLLGLRAVQVLADAGRDELQVADVVAAARQVVEESDPSITLVFTSNVPTHDDDMLSRLMIQISTGERDPNGRFHAEPATAGNMRVAGRLIKESSWLQLVATGLVRNVGKSPSQLFSFVSSHLEHYVLLRALARESGGLQ